MTGARDFSPLVFGPGSPRRRITLVSAVHLCSPTPPAAAHTMVGAPMPDTSHSTRPTQRASLMRRTRAPATAISHLLRCGGRNARVRSSAAPAAPRRPEPGSRRAVAATVLLLVRPDARLCCDVCIALPRPDLRCRVPPHMRGPSPNVARGVSEVTEDLPDEPLRALRVAGHQCHELDLVEKDDTLGRLQSRHHALCGVASAWLRRNPSTPSARPPTATRTDPDGSTALRSCSRSMSSCPGSHTHLVDAPGLMMSGRQLRLHRLLPAARCGRGRTGRRRA